MKRSAHDANCNEPYQNAMSAVVYANEHALAVKTLKQKLQSAIICKDAL